MVDLVGYLFLYLLCVCVGLEGLDYYYVECEWWVFGLCELCIGEDVCECCECD